MVHRFYRWTNCCMLDTLGQIYHMALLESAKGSRLGGPAPVPQSEVKRPAFLPRKKSQMLEFYEKLK